MDVNLYEECFGIQKIDPADKILNFFKTVEKIG